MRRSVKYSKNNNNDTKGVPYKTESDQKVKNKYL